MKWLVDGSVNFRRGNHTPLVVRFDNSRGWLAPSFCGTTSTVKASFKALGERYGAKVAEVKAKYTEDGAINFEQAGACEYVEYGDGRYSFRVEHNVPEGHKREFTYFDEAEIFVG